MEKEMLFLLFNTTEADGKVQEMVVSKMEIATRHGAMEGRTQTSSVVFYHLDSRGARPQLNDNNNNSDHREVFANGNSETSGCTNAEEHI